jgi:hypothetical protein
MILKRSNRVSHSYKERPLVKPEISSFLPFLGYNLTCLDPDPDRQAQMNPDPKPYL